MKPNKHTQPQPPPPPELSKTDRQRLRLFLEDHNEDAHAFAAAISQNYLDILDWLDSPPIRRYLKLHDEARKRAEAAARRKADRQAAPIRAVSIHMLKHSLDRTLADNRSQTSLRRASTAYLRALATADPLTLSLATRLALMPAPPPSHAPSHAGDEPPPPSPTSDSPPTAIPRVSPSPDPSPSSGTPSLREGAGGGFASPSPDPPTLPTHSRVPTSPAHPLPLRNSA